MAAHPASDAEEPPPERPKAAVRLGRLWADLRQKSHFLFPLRSQAEWQALRQAVTDDGQLTGPYLLMCALSAGIATLGLLQSSTAVVIGAMLISPLMGPIAALGFGFASLDGQRIRETARVITMGAVIGIGTGLIITITSPINNATPEIIARTEPTLLDLVVAVISGLAGAYATVQQKGATAIGVAIATALMPPLATVGYGLGVGNAGFAAGAFLLFLTNLAAIGFAFAAVARISGAAQPLEHVSWNRRHGVAAVLGFVVLATPLGLTLRRVSAEARAQTDARAVLMDTLKIRPVNIAQLQVSWPLNGVPSVDAVVVEQRYITDAETRISEALTQRWGVAPVLNLQQVVADDVVARTAAVIDAAAQRTAIGIARDTPPLAAIRTALRLPVQGIWTNRANRSVQLVPFAIPGWTLRDYCLAEVDAVAAGGDWEVRLVPPFQSSLELAFTVDDLGKVALAQSDDLRWALERWGISAQRIRAHAGRSANPTEQAVARAAAQEAARLFGSPSTSIVVDETGDAQTVIIDLAPARPGLTAVNTAKDAQ